jgi:hypothetical protein
MSRLERTMAAVGRGAAWLLPAGRRDWIAAVWAEAHEVPPGAGRLAWRAGGVWMLAREALLPRRIARAALFGGAAAAAAWAAWPEPTVGHAAVGQFHVIATVLLLAGFPLLARRFFGPASASRAGRSLRVFCCAAVLAFLPALAIVEAFANLTPARPAYKYVFCIAQGWSDASQGCGGVPGQSTGGPAWAGEIVLLLLTAGYVGVILFLTSRRSLVTRSTLAIGIGTGLLLGVVMYVVAPLGLNNYATDPWLPGSLVDPLVVLAWILLVGGPVVVAVLASRRCRDVDGWEPSHSVRVGQGIAAGVLATGTGAMFVTALGTGTTALLLKSEWLRHWLYHGHLSALATYRHEIYAGNNVNGYALILMAFPVIGLIVSAATVACTMPAPRESGPEPGADEGRAPALS